MTQPSGIEYLPLPGWKEAGDNAWTISDTDYEAGVFLQKNGSSPETKWEWRIVKNDDYRDMGWEVSPRRAMKAAMERLTR
jgi:hypothetical protein